MRKRLSYLEPEDEGDQSESSDDGYQGAEDMLQQAGNKDGETVSGNGGVGIYMEACMKGTQIWSCCCCCFSCMCTNI